MRQSRPSVTKQHKLQSGPHIVILVDVQESVFLAVDVWHLHSVSIAGSLLF